MDPKEIAQFIVCLAKRQDAKLTTLRLVKFLYLIDLFYARETGGKTLTGWPWKFVHFGPFCAESLNAIEGAVKTGLIIPENHPSKYEDSDYTLFTCEEDTEAEIAIPSYVESKIKFAMKKWADDSSGLLDYVYFETEPMLDAKPGDILDFGLAEKIEKENPIQMKKLSKEKLQKGREALKALVKGFKDRMITLTEQQITKDEDLEKFLNKLDGKDIPSGIYGTAKIVK